MAKVMGSMAATRLVGELNTTKSVGLEADSSCENSDPVICSTLLGLTMATLSCVLVQILFVWFI